MPIYIYVCGDCGSRCDLILPVNHEIPTCPVCDQPMRRRLSPPALKFVGEGWTKPSKTETTSEPEGL
jgi:putative FmdB family regulatory protein